MEIIHTTKVVPTENPINTYCISAEFDTEYGGGGEAELLTLDKNLIIGAHKLYTSYEKGLTKDWNTYCNGDIQVMNQLASDAGLTEDNLCELWPANEAGYNMLEDFTITYFDETKQKMRKPKERISCINCRNEISKSNFERHYKACIKPPKVKNGTKGKYNPRAKTIKIFDNTNTLQYLCEGTFVETCKKESLSYTHFTKSYKENGTGLYYNTTSAQLTKLIKSGNIKYKGWYALIID